MVPEKVPEGKRVKRVALDWAGRGLVFRGGRPGGVEIPIDGDSAEGPSPMDTFLLGLSACMGSDIVHILKKSRVPLEALRVEARGDRAEENPRRYLRIEIVFRATRPGWSGP
jgi:putative redox protein